MPDMQVHRYDRAEFAFVGPDGGNPSRDVWLRATWTHGTLRVEVDGFCDGDGVYRVRFMPDAEGLWELETESNAPALHGLRRSFECIRARPGIHGPVRVHDTYHFRHDDGTPYYPFGTTCYVWTHQPEALQERTLETLRSAGFNKMRMAVFPKHYLYNSGEPVIHPCCRDEAGELVFDRPNPVYYQALERRIDQLAELGIQVDLILFHPYDRWGYARMGHANDLAYLRYVVARLSSFHNVWWSLANEYDFMLAWRTVGHWDEFFQTIQRHDPYDHLRSIHNGDLDASYDHTKPWVTHVCIQHPNVERAREWRTQYGKPVIDDECEYEGNVPMPWGNISAQELVHRFWVAVCNGTYAGHGETYTDPDEELWWSKGGVLRGESAERIAFLRMIVEQGPGPLTPLPRDWVWTRVTAAGYGDYRLIYFGPHQPVAWGFGLPQGCDFAVDWIDTWNMTVHEVEGTFRDVREVPMPGRPYLAARIRPLL